MDWYTLINAALTGFYCFAAIFYFISWWHSRSEKTLLAFAAMCLLCTLFCPCLILLANARTVSEAQSALSLRLTLGPCAHASALMFLGLVGADRIKRGVFYIILFQLSMAVLNFFMPLKGTVISLEHITLPTGVVTSYPTLGPHSIWLPIYFVSVAAGYVYGIYVASGFWARDRIGSLLIGGGALASFFGNAVAFTIDILGIKGFYVGAVPHTVFVLCMAMFLARQHAARRDRLRESEERLRFALEAGRLGVWKQDLATGAYYGDDRSFEIFKLSMRADRKFPFDTWKTLVDPHDLPRVLDSLSAAEKGAKGVSVGYGFTRLDGEHCYAEIAASAITIDGQPAGVIGMVWDTTQRRRAEEELRTSEERFRLLIEKATDIITVVNSDGINRYVSPNIKQYLGYEPEELLDRSSFEFIEPVDVEKVSKAIQTAMSGSATVTVEYRFRHRDGSWRNIESIGRSIPNQAKDGFIVVNSRDITESLKLSEHVRQAQKMDAIGALAGGVAHDFNNLLTVINGRSELMLMRLAPDAKYRKEINLIMETGARAASLTRQLLAFSRRQVLEPKIIDLNQIVNEMNNMLRRLVPEDISITAVLEEKLRPTKADPGQMEQVLMNLVVNARDAMPSGGRLTVNTANVECDDVLRAQHPTIPLGSYVTMTVSDTGCGMTKEVKARIFEPFFTTKELGKGTGLGLATVFGIVKQSNGHITLYSEPGKGATFCIYLPVRLGEGDVMSEVRPAVRMGNGETILIVEDEDTVRELACEVLETMGYKVLQAKDGEEGLAVFGQNKEVVKLVMTDAIMPKMGGIELAQRLREIDPNVKVILLSGYTDHTLAEDGTVSIASGFVQKPFTAGALTRKISEVLGN